MIVFVIVSLIVIAACSLTLAMDSYDFGRWRYLGPAVGIGLTIFFGWLSFGTERTVTFVVDGKERIAEDNDGKWMVYAKDGATYEDTDAWFHGKTHSTDLYRDVEVGHRLRCKVNGFRVGLLSNYPNLLRCADLDSGKLLRY